MGRRWIVAWLVLVAAAPTVAASELAVQPGGDGNDVARMVYTEPVAEYSTGTEDSIGDDELGLSPGVENLAVRIPLDNQNPMRIAIEADFRETEIHWNIWSIVTMADHAYDAVTPDSIHGAFDPYAESDGLAIFWNLTFLGTTYYENGETNPESYPLGGYDSMPFPSSFEIIDSDWAIDTVAESYGRCKEIPGASLCAADAAPFSGEAAKDIFPRIRHVKYALGKLQVTTSDRPDDLDSANVAGIEERIFLEKETRARLSSNQLDLEEMARRRGKPTTMTADALTDHPTVKVAPNNLTTRPVDNMWSLELLISVTLAVALPLLALLHRLRGETVLESTMRRKLLNLIGAEPGIRECDLARDLVVHRKTVSFHLRHLKRFGFVEYQTRRRQKFCFPTNPPLDPEVIYRRVVCGNPKLTATMEAISLLPNASLTELARELSISRQSLTKRIERLEAAGVARRVPMGRRMVVRL